VKKRILSFALALCLCISSQSVVHASHEELLQQEDVLAAESTSRLVTRDSTVPTPAEVYQSMIALKDQEQYKEGTPWTDDEPYSDSKGYYYWKGGNLDGHRISAVGCVAFAFILSDTAFGSLPARMYAEGKFAFEDIKPGDILRVNNDVHTVIVLEVNDAGVVVAEGNISTGDHQGRVHWGRAISKEEVMKNTSHYITRYPEGYIPEDDPDADKLIADGALEGGLAWNLTKAGKLTISGNGSMPDFSSVEEQPWSDKSDQIRKIVIENGVTSIGSCAFWKCGVLSAEISSSVTTIGNHAFRESSIIAASIPSNVKTIGDSAFRGCKNLSEVTISEGVETIGQNAFSACSSLAKIALPASIGEVGAAAFFQCQALISATFAPGSKQVKLGDNIFMQCYYLMSVTLPQNIDRISMGMFQNCLMLPGVEITQGAESICESAFASCGAFTTVIIPDSVTSIERSAFASCPLSDIYYTGTEEQWNNVWKSGDTVAVISKAKMHYNYVPGTNPGPGDGDGDNPGGDNPGGDNPGGDNPGGDNPGGDNPGGDNPGGDNPGGDNPGGDNPGGDNPGGDNPGGDNPGGDNPGGDNPGGDNPEVGADISKATVTLSSTSYVYDGKPKLPSVTVKLDGKTLVLNTDYIVSYKNNVQIGTAEVIVEGKGDYTGSKTVSFTIKKEADQNPPAYITCNKTVYEVKYGAKPFKIKASSNYKMTYTSSNPKIVTVGKNTGEATIKNTGVVTITIKAEKASKKVTVKVSPKKPSVKTTKVAKGKKLTVTWAKDKMASGYQVRIATDAKFKKNVKSKNVTKTSYTFTKLKTGKKYYVSVRSYKKSTKGTLYGEWSKTKLSAKIKK